MAYEIHEAQPDRMDYTPYGAASEFLHYRGPEAIISGPAETGKTLGALWKLHLCACKYPDSSIVICRKTLTSIYSTVLVTFQKMVLGDNWPFEPYGGEKPQWFPYPNGSRIWVAGLDKASRVLSAEHDIIYVNQAEELILEDWETLTTRATGRAGNMPYAQTIGDMNPAYPAHWIYRRESLQMFYSWHRENPMLYDQDTGEITEQGQRTMAVLEALTGTRKKRLKDGMPAQAEGAVYDEWNDEHHLVDRFDIPDDWRRFCAVDFGYTNPFVCQWWAVDNDGRMYLYRQYYMTQRTVRAHAARLRALTGDEAIETAVCDHDAEDRATLAEEGISNCAADKRVSVGIDKVKERLKPAADGRPRLFILRDGLAEVDPALTEKRLPLTTEDELPGYVWSDRAAKEVPIKEHDHGMDALRYAVMYLDGGSEFTWGFI